MNTNKELTIHYKEWIKNKNRGGRIFYCRVTQKDRKAYDVNLKTTDPNRARAWVELRESELETVNRYIRAGENVPSSLMSRIECADNRNTAKEVARGSEYVQVEAAIAMWLDKVERGGRRGTTLRTYREISRRFYSPVIMNDITSVDRSTVIRLASKWSTFSLNTRRNMYLIARLFLSWAMDHFHFGERSMLDELPSVKCDPVPHTTWTMEEMLRIADAAPSENYRLYFKCLAVTGARNTEMFLTQFRDLREENGVYYIFLAGANTKGRHDRSVPIPAKLAEALIQLHGERPDTDKLFPKLTSSMSRRNSVLSECVKKAGAPKGTLHTFRHSASMYYYKESSMDIKSLSQLFGHSEAVALKYYQQARSVSDLASAVNAATEKFSSLL